MITTETFSQEILYICIALVNIKNIYVNINIVDLPTLDIDIVYYMDIFTIDYLISLSVYYSLR